MDFFRLVLNILWVLTGGAWMAAAWLLASLLMFVSIVGIPWARASLTISLYTLLPFGHRVVPRYAVTGREDFGTGSLGFVGNVLWLALAGWWLALGHVVIGCALAVTLIGLPFAWAHFKLAGLALWPIGKKIVSLD